jgi:hypothetical protein
VWTKYIVALILNHGTKWSWAINGALLPFTLKEITLMPVGRRLGGSQSWSICFGEEINLFLLLGINSFPDIKPIAQSLYKYIIIKSM